jgi:ABC-type Mn2+/Zn2+ transport system ATPase subunit
VTSPGAGRGRALLRAESLSIAYEPGRPVLQSVDLAVHPADFTGIVGPSGSGKTTLLHALAGSLNAPRRRRHRDSHRWSGTVDRQPGVRVAYVPQLETVNWDFPVTVFECALMGRPQRGLRMSATRGERAAIVAALDRLGIADLAGRHIRELSGGQQQRMFLARALLADPQVLLLDEPTSGVDITTRHAVLHLLADIAAEGVAVVLTTHDLNGMAAHLPQVICLNTRVVAAGSPADVFTAPVLEATFGAGLDVLSHLGMPVIVDAAQPTHQDLGSAGTAPSGHGAPSPRSGQVVPAQVPVGGPAGPRAGSAATAHDRVAGGSR